MSIDNLLNVELEEKIEILSNMNPGTEEYKLAVDNITKLLDRSIEMNKIDYDRKERKEVREEEAKSKIESNKVNKKHYIIDTIVTIIGIAVPASITVWGTKTSFKFEETGSITTIIGRGFIDNIHKLVKFRFK